MIQSFLEKEVDVQEYLIIISPPQRIKSKVRALKKDYSSRFGAAYHLDSQAHISLNHFYLPLAREEILKKELTHYLSDTQPFMVKISGIKGFANNGLIFLGVEKQKVIELQRKLTLILRQRMRIPKKHSPFFTEPHMTIARSYTLTKYLESWAYFSKITFPYQDQFQVDGITVLGRTCNVSRAKYRTAFEIPLIQSPVRHT